MKYNKNDKIQLSAHFNSSEFNCPCTYCKITLIDPELVIKLESTRSQIGTKLKITSAYRCSQHQNELRLRGYETAKGISTHELGQAADITNGVSLGIELAEAAEKAGFTSIGIGKHFVHLDLRDGQRRWTYSY